MVRDKDGSRSPRWVTAAPEHERVRITAPRSGGLAEAVLVDQMAEGLASMLATLSSPRLREVAESGGDLGAEEANGAENFVLGKRAARSGELHSRDDVVEAAAAMVFVQPLDAVSRVSDDEALDQDLRRDVEPLDLHVAPAHERIVCRLDIRRDLGDGPLAVVRYVEVEEKEALARLRPPGRPTSRLVLAHQRDESVPAHVAAGDPAVPDLPGAPHGHGQVRANQDRRVRPLNR